MPMSVCILRAKGCSTAWAVALGIFSSSFVWSSREVGSDRERFIAVESSDSHLELIYVIKKDEPVMFSGSIPLRYERVAWHILGHITSFPPVGDLVLHSSSSGLVDSDLIHSEVTVPVKPPRGFLP